MTLTALLNRTCTITRRTPGAATDTYGNKIPSETNVATVCELQQQRRDERGDQAETSDTGWLLILPAATTIDTGDRVIVDGLRYEVVGQPWEARNPRLQAVSHIEATLRRTAGETQGS